MIKVPTLILQQCTRIRDCIVYDRPGNNPEEKVLDRDPSECYLEFFET